jgi:hypothetical protein
MILQIPPDAKVMELLTSVIWFGNDGVLYSSPREGAPAMLSESQIKNETDRLLGFIGNKKVCIIAESDSKAASPPKHQRELLAHSLESVTKALAIVSTSPLSRMVANLFFSFKPPKYPMKMFSNEAEAKNWITQYL